MKKRQCVRNHRSHKHEGCATRAKAGGEASLEFGDEPEGYFNITCQRAGNINCPIDSAMKGALVRQVLLAEEPTESVAKKCQC